jgi:hypothetical protein
MGHVCQEGRFQLIGGPGFAGFLLQRFNIIYLVSDIDYDPAPAIYFAFLNNVVRVNGYGKPLTVFADGQEGGVLNFSPVKYVVLLGFRNERFNQVQAFIQVAV